MHSNPGLFRIDICLTNRLAGLSPKLGKSSGSLNGTSSDIHVYDCDFGNNRVRMIDVEGGNAAGYPEMVRLFIHGFTLQRQK